MPITLLYAVPLALIFLTLTARTINYRRANNISLGDRGDSELMKRMRVHSNCAEYTPIGLILLGLNESADTPAYLLHAIGMALAAGRAAHAYGMSNSPQIMKLRVAGMVLTISSIAVGALLGGYFAIQRLT